MPPGVYRNATGAKPENNAFGLPTWNPLTDDGDALRLAVNLHLLYGINTDILNHYLALELPSDEPLAATRRAIVRAAAEIGRNMK
jgi:hypothetical protein